MSKDRKGHKHPVTKKGSQKKTKKPLQKEQKFSFLHGLLSRFSFVKNITHHTARRKNIISPIKKAESKKSAKVLTIVTFIIAAMTLVATIFGAYYSYKSYLDSKPAQVHKLFKYQDHYKSINVDSISVFETLLEPNSTDRYFIGSDKEDLNSLEQYAFPIVMNQSNKSINNFKVNVSAILYGFTYLDDDVNKNFRIIKKDSLTLGKTLELEYKYSILHAKSCISNPINVVTPLEYVSQRFVTFDFHITYDGILEPISYTVILVVSDNIYSYQLSDEDIDGFLSGSYSNGYLMSESSLITIYLNTNFCIICDKFDYNNSKEDFEKYKSDIIKKYRYYKK